MYVTRPLSLYRNNSGEPEPEPPEGPNTGVLVMEDEAAETRWMFGLLKAKSVKVAPFPQNKLLELRYSSGVRVHQTTHSPGVGEHQTTHYLHAMLIPVLNQPLSSNQYYIIKSKGTQKGLAYTSSGDDDMCDCCCFGISDTPPQIFDPTNPYQQFQINNYIYWGKPHGFVSKSMALDGRPPYFFRHKGWRAYTKTLDNFEPTQALGLDAALRARVPDLNCEPVVVGKWYCPFIFIRDGEVSAQMRNSPHYEMTLTQKWEQIYGCYNLDGELVGNNGVAVDVSVKRQAILVRGSAVERVVVDGGVMWFDTSEVGLSMAIVERMKWEQERCGFKWGFNEKPERIVRTEEFEGKGEWKRFECYILVERFVLKRMDESVVLTWEFKHTHQIRTKWE